MTEFVHLRTAEHDHMLFLRADAIVGLERLDEASTRVMLDRRMCPEEVTPIDVLESITTIEQQVRRAAAQDIILERKAYVREIE